MLNNSNQSPVMSCKRILILVALVMLTALFRVRNFDSFWNGNFLWAEDGNVFINEAASLGVYSLWQPYAGYLHLYPRIIAYLSNGLDALVRPFPMVLAWFFAYLYMFFVLIRSGINLGFNFLSLILLVLLVSWQPNSGEVFFNITNAQWLLGVALTFLVVEDKKYSYLSVPGLFLLGLTGPFVIVLVPILAVRAWYFNDLKDNRWLYLSLVICVIVQLYFLKNSGRVTADIPLAPLSSWLFSFLKMLSFGAKDWIFSVVALCFWIGTCVAIITGLQIKRLRIKVVKILLLFCAALLFYMAAAYSSKIDPLLIAPNGTGNRYSWIPFTLIFFSVLWLSKHKLVIQLFIFLMAFTLCADSFRHNRMTNLQYPSFANFSRYQSVVIPINPVWAEYPSWHIHANAIATENGADRLTKKVVAWHIEQADDGAAVPTSENKGALFSTEKISCTKALDMALEVEMIKSEAGWVDVLWASNTQLSIWSTLRRWYPKGHITMQFAFPYSNGGVDIRLLLANFSNKEDQFLTTTAFCLP